MVINVTYGMEPEALIRAIATIRMFVAAHNVVIPGDRINGDELELLDRTADELEEYLNAYRSLVEAERRKS